MSLSGLETCFLSHGLLYIGPVAYTFHELEIDVAIQSDPKISVEVDSLEVTVNLEAEIGVEVNVE